MSDSTAARTDTDAPHLARAIELAGRGLGRVSPNPLVGAVIVKGGEVVGEGHHESFGGPHAEVSAIAAAGDTDLHGATMYVSLEPCCHEGKTPPCTTAIAEAGIARVVIASDDPSEHASGRGPGILRDEGIEVEMVECELAERARRLEVDLRGVEPGARPPLARRMRRGGGRHRDRAGRRPTAHRARGRRRAPAAARGVRLARAPAAGLQAGRGRPRGA